MKTYEDSSNKSQRTDSPWDELRKVEFKGKKDDRGFEVNEKYINDFGEGRFRNILKSKEALLKTSADYLSQYEPDSKARAITLAGKESLDHFVLKRLTSNNPEMFIKSQEFKNYSDYIAKIADSKKFQSKDGEHCLYPEYFTNPVLKDKNLRELVLKTAYPDADIDKMHAWLNREESRYYGTINYFVKEGIDKRCQLNQKQMDILGDYIYAGKNFNDGVAKKYAEYCFNEIKPSYNLKASTPMLGALANYFASQYTVDDDVKKNSRFIIANRSEKEGDLHIGASTKFGCVLEQNHFSRLSLTSDNSLNKSRTNLDENNDLYRFMMISFHELTHDHQKNAATKGDKSSSAMMYIMRDILNQGSGCYIGHKKDGTEIKGSYYKANHDNDEIEIQADEEAWRQCRLFLVDHQKEYYEWSHPDKELLNRFWERRTKCQENEEEVRRRRSFTKKLSNTHEELNAIKYDIETLKKVVSSNPSVLQTYPHLIDYIDATGSLRPSLFTNIEIAKREKVGLDYRDDVFGAEIGTYMLLENNEVKKLMQYIRSNGNSFSNQQAKTLVSNLYNIVHQTVEKNRTLKDMKAGNYDETNARGKDFDMTEKKTSILRQYLALCYASVNAINLIKEFRPEKQDELDNGKIGYVCRYFDQLVEGTNLDLDTAKRAIANYEKTNDPALIMMAKQIRKTYNL